MDQFFCAPLYFLHKNNRDMWDTDSMYVCSAIGGGGRGCNRFVPLLGGNGTKIAPTGDIFDQPPGQMG